MVAKGDGGSEAAAGRVSPPDLAVCCLNLFVPRCRRCRKPTHISTTNPFRKGVRVLVSRQALVVAGLQHLPETPNVHEFVLNTRKRGKIWKTEALDGQSVGVGEKSLRTADRQPNEDGGSARPVITGDGWVDLGSAESEPGEDAADAGEMKDPRHDTMVAWTDCDIRGRSSRSTPSTRRWQFESCWEARPLQ